VWFINDSNPQTHRKIHQISIKIIGLSIAQCKHPVKVKTQIGNKKRNISSIL
jgi:hypothetical protein